MKVETQKSEQGEPVKGLAPVEIDPQRQQLIGLRTVEVTEGPVGESWRTNGRVAIDETRVRRVNVKVPGFVERNRKVDLNAAGAKRLTALSGIGPVLAKRIVAYRKEHGDFSRPAELEEVSGIGPSTLEEIRDRLKAEG